MQLVHKRESAAVDAVVCLKREVSSTTPPSGDFGGRGGEGEEGANLKTRHHILNMSSKGC